MSVGFAYRGGQLCADRVPLGAIAEAVGTPAYVYSGTLMRARLRQFLAAFADQRVLVCYALKANSNLAVIRTLADEGAGAEIVSGGELQRALAAGVPPARIVFSGVGKSRDEMLQALDARIAQFNVESVPELIALGEVAAARRLRAPVALRINPDVAADTHDKISTGRRHDKFGIASDQALAVYELARRLAGIELVGLHLHIGSQILSLAPFEAAYRRGLELVRALARRRDPSAAARSRRRPGGAVSGGAGARSYRICGADRPVDRRVGSGAGVRARALSGGRGRGAAQPGPVPQGRRRSALRGSGRRHEQSATTCSVRCLPSDPAGRRAVGRTPGTAVDVVGPICESTDVFARARDLPPLGAGDLVAFAGAGAYGAVMASDYNSRPHAAEVMVEGTRFAVVKPRIEPAARLADERLPDWLRAAALERGAAG